MKRTTCSLLLPLVLLLVGPTAAARAAEPDAWTTTAEELRGAVARPSYARCPSGAAPRRAWTFQAALPVWIPGVSGEFTSGGVKVDTDGGVGDVLDGTVSDLFDLETDLDFAFVGSFQARHGPWTFAVEGFGASLANNLEFRLLDGTLVDASISAAIASARVGYRVWTKPLGLCRAGSCLKVDAYAGLRWYYASFELTLPRGNEADASRDWVDPIVGLDAELTIGRHWVVHARGDVGGFGVGADFAWWLTAGLEYRFSRVFSLGAGWAVMDADYSTGRGDDRFAWNLTLSGPQVIAGFRF